MNILNKRYLYFALSLLVIVPGMVTLVIYGAPLSIDFTSGSLMEVSFSSNSLPPTGEVVAALDEAGIQDAEVRTTADNTLLIRAAFLEEQQGEDAASAQMVAILEGTFSDAITVLRFENVGPTIGQQVTQRAALAVGVAALAIVLYITLAF
ncbi:MAG: protein translocase subunit SecF, partial [Chloroflexi bacterium]|nr:protein translocase subunit SecF [Chloroflexota bacterium]